MASRLVTVATTFHLAPSPIMALAPINKQPAAGLRTALTYPGEIVGRKQLCGIKRDRPQNPFQVSRRSYPFPVEALFPSHEYSAATRIAHRPVKTLKDHKGWLPLGGNGREDLVNRFPHSHGMLQGRVRGHLVVGACAHDLLCVACGKDPSLLCPLNHVFVNIYLIHSLRRSAIVNCVGKIQAQTPASELKFLNLRHVEVKSMFIDYLGSFRVPEPAKLGYTVSNSTLPKNSILTIINHLASYNEWTI